MPERHPLPIQPLVDGIMRVFAESDVCSESDAFTSTHSRIPRWSSFRESRQSVTVSFSECADVIRTRRIYLPGISCGCSQVTFHGLTEHVRGFWPVLMIGPESFGKTLQLESPPRVFETRRLRLDETFRISCLFRHDLRGLSFRFTSVNI